MRKKCKKTFGRQNKRPYNISKTNLEKFTDKKVFEISLVDTKPQVGIVSGLAWTAVGGDVLTIEAIKIKGKGALQLTGSLGEVMKESVRIAHSVVKILIDNGDLKISPSVIPHSAKEREERITVDAVKYISVMTFISMYLKVQHPKMVRVRVSPWYLLLLRS